jgi:hypothetical protein
MAWLAKLDARAEKWPRPLQWAYTAVKAILIVLGAGVLVNWYIEKVRYFDTWF